LAVSDRKQITNTREFDVEPPSEPAQVFRVLRDYVQQLAEADSPDDVFVALGAVGAHFHMPHIEVVESDRSGTAPNLRQVYLSPGAPQPVLKALHSHPLFEWARDSQRPIFLSEVDEKLALRGIRRASPLATIEAVLANLEVAPGHFRHFGFLGEGGLANGLSRSLLHVATLLAHQRLSAQPPRAVAAQGVAAQTAPMTPREREVLDIAMAGLSDSQIGIALGLATRTVRFHLENAKRKFGVSTRRELIALVARGLGADRK
jgi:DNA-binding CsgD family transcriptional regulator